MAETKFTYISLANLQLYDSLMKTYVDGKVSDGVAKSLKTVAIEGNTLKFYTVEEPVGATSPAYTIELPEADLSDLIHKIKNATAGDVVTVNADGTLSDGGVQLSDLAKSANVTTEINKAKDALAKDIKSNSDAIKKLNGAETVDGSVAKAVKDAKDSLQSTIDANKKDVDGKIGDLANLTTDSKTDLVSAVNDVKSAVDAATAGDKITVDTTTTTSGMAKSYTIKQGGKDVATIDIPKDMVVKSGVVEKDPVGQAKGTYLVLTLANATEDKVYINVGTLVDIYTAKANATQIQLAIDSTTREISGSIVAGSITSTEIASNAIVTAKIADGNVTKTKLATDVQTSLGKADTALQEKDVTSLRTDVSNIKTSLAEGGATDEAIKTAQATADAVQADLDNTKKRIDTLESVQYVAATVAEIKAMFPQT